MDTRWRLESRLFSAAVLLIVLGMTAAIAAPPASAEPIPYQLTLTQFFRQTIRGQFPFPVSVTDILGEERFIGTMVVDDSLLNQSIPLSTNLSAERRACNSIAR
jgi:hypothetical protein